MFELRLASKPADITRLFSHACAYRHFKSFIEYCLSLYRSSDMISFPKSLFRPEKISSALPYITINELIGPDHIQLRLIGSQTEIIFGGHDMAGANALDLVPPQNREATLYFFKMTAEQNLVSFLREDLEIASGKRIPCITFGIPMCDKMGINKYRIAITFIEFQENDYIAPSDFIVTRTQTHDLRFARLSSFAEHITPLM